MPATPSILNDLFRSFWDSTQRTVSLVSLAANELGRLDKTIDLMDAMDAVRSEMGMPLSSDHREKLTKVLPMVLEERQNGWPVLFGLATVALWTELEALFTMVHNIEKIASAARAS